MHLKIASKVKPLPNFIHDMHVKVDAHSFRFFGKLFFEMCHHLLADSIFPVGFKDDKSKDIGMELILKILKPDRIASNNDIIIVGEFGELCVLSGNFDIEASGVLNGKCIIVKFPKYVDILIIDITHGDR